MTRVDFKPVGLCTGGAYFRNSTVLQQKLQHYTLGNGWYDGFLSEGLLILYFSPFSSRRSVGSLLVFFFQDSSKIFSSIPHPHPKRKNKFSYPDKNRQKNFHTTPSISSNPSPSTGDVKSPPLQVSNIFDFDFFVL